MSILTLGIPKGSLQDATFELFARAGWKIRAAKRSYFPAIDDPELECNLLRAQEMSRYVESGVLDAGLTGLDWILENKSDIHVVSDLVYSKATAKPTRWVLAVDKNSPIRSIEDLEGKKVATELVNFTRRYFEERGISIKLEFSWGATEAKVVNGLADAIVEVTETGSTIKAHGLQIIHELMQSHTQLIANHEAWADPKKREKIEQIALLLSGALTGQEMVGLKMNVPDNLLDEIVPLLPCLDGPTVAEIYGAPSPMKSVEVVVHRPKVRDLVPELRRRGVRGIIEYPLHKVL